MSCAREAIRVIYCGIDSARFTPDAGERASRPLFAYLGRLKRYKGVDLVLRAFARVRDPAARLVVEAAMRAQFTRLHRESAP